MLLGCAILCERTEGAAEGRLELGWGFKRGGVASEEGTEEGIVGNCCRDSCFDERAIAGDVKPSEVMLSLTEIG